MGMATYYTVRNRRRLPMDKRAIPNQEVAERCVKAQALLGDSELDAVLVFSTESEPGGVRYFADYWPSFETTGVLIPRSGEPTLLIGPESETYARARSRIANILRMKDFRESSMP